MNQTREEQAATDTLVWLRMTVRQSRRVLRLLDLEAVVLLGAKHPDVQALWPCLTALRKLDIALNGEDAVALADVSDLDVLQAPYKTLGAV